MRKTWLIFSQAVTVALAIVFVIATLKPDWLQNRPGSPVPGLLPRVEAPAATTPTGATATTGKSRRMNDWLAVASSSPFSA